MDKFIEHGPCDKCGSSDGVGIYADGHGFCFVCEAYHPSEEKTLDEPQPQPQPEPRSQASNITSLTNVFRAIPKRGLTEEAMAKYGIDVNMNKSIDVGHRYPYFKDGRHVANKVRRRSEKAFYWEGDPTDAELFGQHLFPPGSAKAITLVEGELDAPSGWLLLGSRYPVVSVPSVGHAIKACRKNFEYLNSFDDIVICFDKDEPKVTPQGEVVYPGQDAAQKVAELFAPGKCRILVLEHGKDPNEYRQKGVPPKTFVSEWWAAPKYSPVGLKTGSSMRDEILTEPDYNSIPYPWDRLTRKTYGMRLSEFVLWMADTGIGKTSFFKEIEHHILTHPEVNKAGYGVGILHLEESNRESGLGLLSIEVNKPLHLPDTPKTREEVDAAYNRVLNTERVVFYDHFGSNDIDEILAKVRFMAVMGCKYIFIDHLSIIVSDQSGDERKQLDEISTKLKTLTMELNIHVECIIHTNREGLARGSAGPEKVANIHISLHRNKKDPDEWRRNVTEVVIEKNRFYGPGTGPCMCLFYDEKTGRLVELGDEMAHTFKEGGSVNDTEYNWA